MILVPFIFSSTHCEFLSKCLFGIMNADNDYSIIMKNIGLLKTTQFPSHFLCDVTELDNYFRNDYKFDLLW